VLVIITPNVTSSSSFSTAAAAATTTTTNFGPLLQQASMAMVVVAQPQQVKNDLMVASLQDHRDWSTGLFECFQDMVVCKFA